MKKLGLFFKFIALPILVLTGCGGQNISSTSSENKSSVSSDFSSLSLSSNSFDSSSSNSIASSSSSKFEVDDKTTYTTEKWDDNADLVISNAIGDAYKLIPHYKADTITFYTDIETTESGSSYKISIIEFNPVSAKAGDEYEELLDSASYYYSDTYLCYAKKASATDDLRLAFNLKTKSGHKVLVVESARFTTRKDKWEPDFANIVIGFEIPEVKAESFEYYCDYGPLSTYPYNYYFAAYATGYNIANSNYLVTYKNAVLATNKWILTTNDSYGYVFTSKDGYHTLQIYTELDVYNELCLSMILKSDWPLFFLYSLLGEDLPKLQSNLGTLYYYGIYDTDTYSYLGIYYDVNDLTAYQTYVSSMLTYGYSVDPENQGNYTSKDASIGDVYYSYLTKKIEGEEKEVDVLYSTGAGQLAIIIY